MLRRQLPLSKRPAPVPAKAGPDDALHHPFPPDALLRATERWADDPAHCEPALPLTAPISCEGCGMCCHHYNVDVRNWETYVPAQLVQIEHPQHYKRAPKAVLWLGRRDKDGACVALQEDQRCGIYTQRPAACRTFAVGGKRCLEHRLQAGLAIPAVLLEARAQCEALEAGANFAQKSLAIAEQNG